MVGELQKECLIRMPLIPGVNDGEEELRELAAFLQSLGNRVCLEIMPYHRLGEPKYRRLGRKTSMDCKTPSEADVHRVKKILESEGIELA